MAAPTTATSVRPSTDDVPRVKSTPGPSLRGIKTLLRIGSGRKSAWKRLAESQRRDPED